MELFSLFEKHEDDMLKATSAAGQDAKDVVSAFKVEVLTGELPLPADITAENFQDWACGIVSNRARKARNRVMMERLHPKFLHYTDEPTYPTTPGEISEDQLWALCTSKAEEPRLSPHFQHRLDLMKTVLSSLPPADQEFLRAIQQQKAKDLVPKYGKSAIAVRVRNHRLRSRVINELAKLTKEM